MSRTQQPSALHCYASPTDRQQAEDALSTFDREVLRVLRDLRGVCATSGMTYHYVAREMDNARRLTWHPQTSQAIYAAVRAALPRLAAVGLAQRTERSRVHGNGWKYRATK